MAITAEDRRSVLGLFNVSEAARQLGGPVRKMHWEISTGCLPTPRIRLGRRLYYRAADLKSVAERWREIKTTRDVLSRVAYFTT